MSNPIDIFPSDHSVTGIRSEDEGNTLVIMTGNCPSPNPLNPQDTRGMIYRGPMVPNNTSGCSWNPINSTGCICRLPRISGAASSIFYGPDTPWFTPSIGKGNVRVVGSYKQQGGHDHGVKYEGPLDDIGLENPDLWKTIDMTGGTVANTILHSTMGDLIVGNYDLMVGNGPDGKFNAFIYNIARDECLDLKTLLQLPSSRLITAYGIWKNDININKDSTSYTIAGGIKDDSIGLNVGFLVDFDSKSSSTSNPTQFPYHNAPAPITHFEGITKYGQAITPYGPRFYSLAATGDKNDNNRGAAFAIVERNPDNGSFVPVADWIPVQRPTSQFTTGNTVLEKNLYGIYPKSSNGIQSYVEEVTRS